MDGVLNFNVGVLGHVDSGKTALVAALSQVLSTAALDKNPQSKERGITLDLGFSAFQVPCPDDMKARFGPTVHTLQFTLVDCPGHASLIRTVLVGAHILDLMILVVDANKGVQAQTAECIVIGELLSASMVVALNKVDMLPEGAGRMKAMRKAGRAVMDALRVTRFCSSEIVPVAARPAGADAPPQGLPELTAALLRALPELRRSVDAPLLFMVDHCFLIKGQGTVLTGTVLQGQMAVGDVVELPALKQSRKIKSIQSFHKPVKAVSAGDRAGVCVTQLPADNIERTLLASPGLVQTFEACVCTVEKCRFHSGSVLSRQKVHVTVGHQTVMAQPIFFGLPDGAGTSQEQCAQAMFKFVGKHAMLTASFDASKVYQWQDELHGISGRPRQAGPFATGCEELHYGQEWVLLLLETPVTALAGSVMMATKLDMTQSADEPDCRVAFYGNIATIFDSADDHRKLKLFKLKWRQGMIERVDMKANTAIIKDMFKKETTLSSFMGMQVRAATGELGTLLSPFGKSGKVKAHFKCGLPPDFDHRVALCFQRFVFDDNKRMVQDPSH